MGHLDRISIEMPLRIGDENGLSGKLSPWILQGKKNKHASEI